MTTKPSSQEINQKAAEWAARVDAGDLSRMEQAELDIWLAQDARHLGAFARAQAVLCQLERVGVAAGSQALRGRLKQSPIIGRRAVIFTGGMAASVAVIGTGVTFAWRYLSQKAYATRIGETQIVPLMDGSVVTLNTNSKIAVNYTKTRREISLLQGEALFDVAKNKNRPFIVTAKDTQVRAIGTSFTVKLLPNAPVQVLVQEGTIEVKKPDIPQVAPVRVSVNSKVVSPVDSPIVATPVEAVEVSRDLAWKMGRISFDNTTLKDAADEFARYSEIQIIVDPAVASESITGLFVSNDPIGFARAAATSLHLHAEIDAQAVRISR